MKAKIIRTATVAVSLNVLIKGQLQFLNQFFEIIAVSGKDVALDEVKERENVVVYDITMQRNIAPFKDFVSLIKLYFYFKKEKPLIVHSITPKAGLLSMIAAKFAGVPYRLHTFTGLVFPTRTGIMQKILIKMDQLLCATATHIFPEGQGVKKDLESYKITKKPLKVLANGNVNGIDLAYFNPEIFLEEKHLDFRNSLGIEAQDFVFVFVGRLVGDKGINELIAAFAKIDSKSAAKLLLVGPFEQELDPLKEGTLEAMKANKLIIEVGFQKDVRPYFAISDALVFPSYREGFPNVVMQAGAMGLPSIVTDISGCNEIIVEGENGVIIPTKDENALLKAMQQFIENPIFVAALKKNARKMIAERYEQQIVWDAVKAEYMHLIAQKS